MTRKSPIAIIDIEMGDHRGYHPIIDNPPFLLSPGAVFQYTELKPVLADGSTVHWIDNR